MIAIARRIDPALLVEARAACGALGLTTEEWSGGIPRTPPEVVIAAVEAGERRIPEDVCGLLEASPGVRAILCMDEPLVRPRVTLANGRVILLGPPLDRVRLAGVLRSAVGGDPATSTGAAPDRFEALRRTYWVAWTRGTAGLPIAFDEQRGLTIVIGPTAKHAAVRRAMTGEHSDPRREADLAEALGTDGALLHLTEEGSDWLIYWPRNELPLLLCSHRRIPSRWSIGTAFATSTRRLIRIAAFPGDQLVAGWAAVAPPPAAFAALSEVVLEGGPQTLATLVAITAKSPVLDGVVIEAR